ncbi:MAG: Fe-S cluster assembly protein SufD [Tannerellaceae bacterium]|jgi:Fe-S cluster assembly protein SufD|nr:Fe-S cluster assembly protein SufD [Tannerellaceae bacterium]
MSAHEQYLDLFSRNEADVCRYSPAAMNARRETARRALAERGFPSADEADYRHTDIEAFFAPDYGMNIHRHTVHIDHPYETFRCDVPNLSVSPYFVINDTFLHSPDTAPLPEGAFAGSLKDFCLQYPALAEQYYGQAASSEDNGVVAFNTLFAQDGFALYLPRNTRLSRPLQLINISRSRTDMIANRRLLVILEAGAEARLLVCDHSEDVGRRILITQVAEMFVGEGARWEYYDLEESSEQTCRLSHFHLRQAAGSDVLLNGTTLRNGHTRNDYYARMDGEDADLTLCALAILDDARRIDTHSHVIHATPRSRSRELVKNVLRGESLAVFHGRILVTPGAEKTQAYQINRNLCLSPAARAYSRPQLEIYADDVRCSHGMSAGQLDEAALFYMKSRGIPHEEALILLSIAFAGDVLDTIRIDILKNRLRHLVEKHFRGELAHCASCRLDKSGTK